jgi:hypothetical protein
MSGQPEGKGVRTRLYGLDLGLVRQPGRGRRPRRQAGCQDAAGRRPAGSTDQHDIGRRVAVGPGLFRHAAANQPRRRRHHRALPGPRAGRRCRLRRRFHLGDHLRARRWRRPRVPVQDRPVPRRDREGGPDPWRGTGMCRVPRAARHLDRLRWRGRHHRDQPELAQAGTEPASRQRRIYTADRSRPEGRVGTHPICAGTDGPGHRQDHRDHPHRLRAPAPCRLQPS